MLQMVCLFAGYKGGNICGEEWEKREGMSVVVAFFKVLL